jgi:hypothetical protein
MARAHGRFAQLYVAVTSAGSASPLQHAGSWSLNLATDTVEVTAFGDTTKTYVAGLPDGQLTYSGFADDTASTALITAAVDGVSRKWYAYPFNSTGIYFFGTSFFDTTWETAIDGAVSISGSAKPSAPVGYVGF